MEDLQVVQKKFDELKLSDGEAPSVFFTELEDINNKFEDFQETGSNSYKQDAKEMIIKIMESVLNDLTLFCPSTYLVPIFRNFITSLPETQFEPFQVPQPPYYSVIVVSVNFE